MRTKEQIIEWLRDKNVLNKLMRNMHYYYPDKTFDKLFSESAFDIFMYAFGWVACNEHFEERISWSSLSEDYVEWYNEGVTK